ncbi:hypothetical protein HY745_04805, partial [Candidatus Desantisbacteria bacterium]|nr:hypothetical protein [Candidatus Desantisbacteria bacterium]
KFSILALVGMFLLSICTFVMAGDVALSGKVDVLLEMVGKYKPASTDVETNLSNPDAFNALLIAKAKVNENVTAQISNNFARCRRRFKRQHTWAWCWIYNCRC